jgi:type II secretory ATPase GspE/PulE/Tfp pilus assembly ATPase PilB-like protein
MSSAEASPRVDPSSKAIEARLAHWSEVHKALGEGISPFSEFELLFAQDPATDYWPWLEKASKKPSGFYSRTLLDSHKVVPYPLKSASLKITTLNEYVNVLMARGISLKGFWDKLPALPLFQLGPLYGLGHFNPFHDSSAYFSKDLAIVCQLSLSDYLALWAYCAEQSTMFFDETSVPSYDPSKAINTSSSLDHYLRMSQEEPALAERRRLLIAEFLIDQPTVSIEKQQQLREVLRNNKPEFSISEEYDIAIDYLSDRSPALLPDMIEVSEDHLMDIPLEEWETLKAIPYHSTADTLYLLCTNVSDFAIDDAVAARVTQQIRKIRTPKEHLLRLFQPFQKSQNTAYVETTGATVAETNYAFVLTANDFVGYNPSQDENPNKFAQWVLYEGVNRNVSDIHIERIKGQMTVRYALDGRGVVFTRLPDYRFNPITSTFKRLAGIQLDSLKPGEGRIAFSCSGRPIEVRVSIVYDHSKKPCIVMRLLDKSMGLKKITELGLFTDEVDTLRRCYKRRSGIIIVGGATGDGKSTTLSSIMAELNQEENFCFSLEDPVEYEIDGITQINATADPIRIERGELSFSDGIKKLLRQDPDVIMVGEIRDAYTAETAIEAALTGHLVLSTVHAIDCFSVITRLTKWKLDPFNIADTLVLAISQKLIRKLCDCQVLERVTDPMRAHFKKYGIPIPDNKRAILKEHGCALCNFKGYKGRNALMEFLVVSPAVRELIRDGASSRQILEVVTAEGFRTRYQKGLKKVLSGITSMAEIAPFCTDL